MDKKSTEVSVTKKDKSIFKVGEMILYFGSGDKDQEPLPGMILEIKDQIKISYFEAPLQKIIWVDPDAIEKQSSFRCAHNTECGLCDDSGKCLYE